MYTRARAAVATALLLAAGCDSWLTRPSLYNRVQVVATQPSGEPVPGVSLLLYTADRPMGYASTDSSGEFTFTSVPRGNYGVQATPPAGYHPVADSTNGAGTPFVDGLSLLDDSLAAVHFTFARDGAASPTTRTRAGTRTAAPRSPDRTR